MGRKRFSTNSYTKRDKILVLFRRELLRLRARTARADTYRKKIFSGYAIKKQLLLHYMDRSKKRLLFMRCLSRKFIGNEALWI